MKFLRRKVQGTETVQKEGRVTHREIEITVEREMISLPQYTGASGPNALHHCPCCGQTIPFLHAVCPRQAVEPSLNLPPQRGDV
jgi:hypothetical protein